MHTLAPNQTPRSPFSRPLLVAPGLAVVWRLGDGCINSGRLPETSPVRRGGAISVCCLDEHRAAPRTIQRRNALQNRMAKCSDAEVRRDAGIFFPCAGGVCGKVVRFGEQGEVPVWNWRADSNEIMACDSRARVVLCVAGMWRI